MIDKVIIAEDQESSNLSVQKTMEDLHIRHSDHVFYCDDAMNKIKAAAQRGEPYDLLITDLSFEPDGTPQKIKDGFELIRSVREAHPGIMILVFSLDSSPATIDKLYSGHEADGYVRKARHDVKELKSAFEALSKGQRYFSPEMIRLVKQSKNTYEFTETDISIIRLLSQGYQQKEISAHINKSLSTIEKKLRQIRDDLGYSKNEQLVLFCREMGIL